MTRRLPVAPGAGSAVAAAVLLVALGTVALTARQESPPTIAELAPQAVDEIAETDDQPAATGTGPGGEAPAALTTTTTTPPAGGPTTTQPAIEEPRVRRCIGEPPRQTEDPQSPPCVPYFAGDNGGETAPGVTADEIRVVYPLQAFEDASLAYDIVNFFNQRYEFYGRKIVLKVTSSRGGPQPNPADMQADARDAATTQGAFASLGYPDRKGAEHHYYDALADQGVISSTYRAQLLAVESRFTEHAPHQWGWLPPTDRAMALIGGFVCRSLAGAAPRLAGPPTDTAAVRRFGVLHQRAADGSAAELDELLGAMRSCGADPVVVEDQSASPNGPQTILALTQADVTSVVYVGDVVALRETYMVAASAQGFAPEWIVSGAIDLDLDNSFHGAPPDQASHVLGVTFRDAVLPRQQMPWYWAIKEVAPAKDPTGGTTYSAMARYEQLAVLAAGIQLAGPRLTPETFQAGLHRARFPNPGAGAAPYFQARVSFAGGRHTFTDDASLFWYSPSESGTVDPGFPGATCYVNGGSRFTAATFPPDDAALFAGPCRR